MSAIVRVDLLIYSCVISTLLTLYIIKNHSFSDNSTKLFIAVLASTSIVNLVDILGWVFNGIDSSIAYYLNWISNATLYCIEYIPGFFWLLYFDYKIIDDYKGTKKRAKYYFITEIVILFVVFFSLRSGRLFTITPDNIYHRSNGIYLVVVLQYTQYIIGLVLLFMHRRNINSDIMASILVYLFLPIVATILQIQFYGLTLIWPMFTLANMIAFIFLEKDGMLRDPLTGIYTRGVFEQKVLNHIKQKRAFTLVMIDMDKFKYINDTLGHQAGDEALIELVDLISAVKRKTDMLCRYGGDEFMILVGSQDAKAGNRVRERIEDMLDTRNAITDKGYELQMSLGVLYVPKDNTLSQQEILEKVDQKMYEEKMEHRKEYGELCKGCKVPE